MRPVLLSILLATSALAGVRWGHAAAPPAPTLVLADFERAAEARFPDGWKARDDATASRIYRVMAENGERYLHAAAHAESAQIGLPLSFPLRDYPLLSWRWRIAELPRGADERSAATNDSAAGVYVVFRGSLGGLLPRAIKYVWSAREPRGASFPSPGYASARIVVLESGSEGAGSWRTEIVDVPADYRRLFGSEPPDPQGIALLTDADDTGTTAAADYDDFRVLAPRAAAAGTADTALVGR